MFMRLTSSAFALTIAAAPALALTPEEVWTSWTTYYGTMGYAVTEGSRDLAGETLTVKNAVFTHGAGNDKVVLTLPEVVMQASGDGGVRTRLPGDMTMHVDVKGDEDGPVALDFSVAAPGLEIVSTGDATHRTDKTVAPTMTMTVDKIDAAGDKPDLIKPAVITVTDMAGETVTEEGKSYTSTGSAAKVAITLDIAADGSTVKGEGSLSDLAGTGKVVLPASGKLDIENDFAKALNDGAAMDATVKIGANTLKVDYTGKTDSGESKGNVTGSGQGAEVSFRLSKDGIGYQGGATGIDAAVTDSQMPIPVSYKLDSASFDLQGPVSKTDTPAPFKLAYSLGGLTLGDAIWNMIDPGKKLPRDPASLDIDVTGQTRIKTDLFALAQKAAADAAKAEAPKADAGKADPTLTEPPAPDTPDTDMPFDPVSVTLNQLSLQAVGAKISATGDLKAPEGGTLEAPVGTVHAKLEGVNTLLDTLVSMGLVPQEQVQGYRMMLAMFTKSSGTDEMTSDIEFKDDGSVLANGQKIK